MMCCGLYTVDSFWYQKIIVLQLQVFLVGEMQAEQRSITLQCVEAALKPLICLLQG